MGVSKLYNVVCSVYNLILFFILTFLLLFVLTMLGVAFLGVLCIDFIPKNTRLDYSKITKHKLCVFILRGSSTYW